MSMPYVTEMESLKAQLSELRAENARLSIERDEAADFANTAFDKKDAEIARLNSELERESKDLQAISEEAERVDNVRLDEIARLVGEVADLSDRGNDLILGVIRYKEALEKAKVALDWLWDHSGFYEGDKAMFVGTVREALTTINEVLSQ